MSYIIVIYQDVTGSYHMIRSYDKYGKIVHRP